MENVVTEEFISRAEVLKDFEACNAENPRWTPQRVKTLLLRQRTADAAPMAYGWRKTAYRSAQIAVKNTNGMTTVHLTARTAEQK